MMRRHASFSSLGLILLIGVSACSSEPIPNAQCLSALAAAEGARGWLGFDRINVVNQFAEATSAPSRRTPNRIAIGYTFEDVPVEPTLDACLVETQAWLEVVPRDTARDEAVPFEDAPFVFERPFQLRDGTYAVTVHHTAAYASSSIEFIAQRDGEGWSIIETHYGYVE